MAKLIRKHFGKVVSVEPTAPSDIDSEWSWRKAYEGFYGIIHVYQSERRFPGKYFIVIYDIELHYLKTSAGELITDGNRVTLITKNSKYTFERLDIQETEGE